MRIYAYLCVLKPFNVRYVLFYILWLIILYFYDYFILLFHISLLKIHIFCLSMKTAYNE